MTGHVTGAGGAEVKKNIAKNSVKHQETVINSVLFGIGRSTDVLFKLSRCSVYS